MIIIYEIHAHTFAELKIVAYFTVAGKRQFADSPESFTANITNNSAPIYYFYFTKFCWTPQVKSSYIPIIT